MKKIGRREFIKTVAVAGAALGVGNVVPLNAFMGSKKDPGKGIRPVVSVAQIKNDNIDYAVREAIDLLGGIKAVSKGKERIMLKPNLVSPESRDTTNLAVIKALAQLMTDADKNVSIGEGSAAAGPNFRPGIFGRVCSTTDKEMLNGIQQSVFDRLGYSELAKSTRIPLVNLHTGKMSKVSVRDGFVYKEIRLHHSLTEIDMLCSVPMMKTHGLATVTLGMKNLIGLYPGQVYGTVRSAVHREAAKVEQSGTASAVVDMVRANKVGLVVIDASVAMQGQGPSVHQGGQLVKMDLIIAGMNSLATDMVAAHVMGFQPKEISTFVWAWKAGMSPTCLNQIEIRGAKLEDVRRDFLRPAVYPWEAIKNYGPACI